MDECSVRETVCIVHSPATAPSHIFGHGQIRANNTKTQKHSRHKPANGAFFLRVFVHYLRCFVRVWGGETMHFLPNTTFIQILACRQLVCRRFMLDTSSSGAMQSSLKTEVNNVRCDRNSVSYSAGLILACVCLCVLLQKASQQGQGSSEKDQRTET